MNSRRRTIPTWVVAGAAAIAAALGLAAIPVSSNADPSLGQLHSQLGAVQAREQSLASSISSLSNLISSLDSQIALVESREAAVRADLARDRAKLVQVQAALTRERKLLALLKARLARARMLLGRQLVSNYEQSKPNLVSVVLESNGFTDLLDKLTYLKDAQQEQQAIIKITTQAKERADAAATRLAALEASVRQITARDRATGPRAGGHERAPARKAGGARAGAERSAGRARGRALEGSGAAGADHAGSRPRRPRPSVPRLWPPNSSSRPPALPALPAARAGRLPSGRRMGRPEAGRSRTRSSCASRAART